MASNSISKMIEFMSLVGQLKRVRRMGWVHRHVSEPESVADHMYRMAVMSLCIGQNTDLNRDRCMRLALVHDMAESIVGDIVPSDNISKEEKHKREEAAMKYISSLVDKEIGEDLYNLWSEYETQSSKESKFVKDIDKFEMVLQAYEYEQLDKRPKGLQEFFESTKGKFQTPIVQSWVTGLEEIRNNSQSDSPPK